jgi:glycosyltransferase involved in cell wall biosynthesis
VSGNERIILVGNDADYFFSHRLPIAKRASEMGYDVHVAAPFKKDDIRKMSWPFVFHRVALRRGGFNPVEEVRTFVELLSLYRRLKPTLVHHVTIKPTLYGGLAARLAGVPAVVNAMTGLGFLFMASSWRGSILRSTVRLLLRSACRGPNVKVIFQNPTDLETFVRLRICRRSACVLIRGSGVDTRVFKPSPEPPEPVVVMLLGRMLWDKGVKEFVGAAKRHREQGANARFVLVGNTDPNPMSVKKAQLEEWQREGFVEWWGWRDDIPTVLSQAHIVCLPSYHEGLPKVLLEAASSARPIVATNIPGCREIVRHGENGYLVPAKDVEALTNAIGLLIRSRDARVEMGSRGRMLVETEFALPLVLEQTMQTYSAALDSIACRRECTRVQ